MRPCSSKGRKEEGSIFHFLHKFIWIRVGFPAVLTGCVRTAGNFCGWGQGKMQKGTGQNADGDTGKRNRGRTLLQKVYVPY